MIKVKYWIGKSLPPYLLKDGVAFIRKRFFECWDINRTDVTYDLVLSRKNITLFDDSKIIGWLGIENDGQLTNACIEKGYKGIDNLVTLIEEAYCVFPSNYKYANVPVSRTASARAFLISGMKLAQNPRLFKLKYPEKEVTLVKLFTDLGCNLIKPNSSNYIEMSLLKIKELDNGPYRLGPQNMGSDKKVHKK